MIDLVQVIRLFLFDSDLFFYTRRADIFTYKSVVYMYSLLHLCKGKVVNDIFN